MKIAIDFDGTLIENAEYPTWQYELKPYAKAVVKELAKKHELVLCSARYGWYRLPMLLFIRQNKLPIKATLRNKKAVADVYVDDHGMFVDGINWIEVMTWIESRTKKVS